MSRQVSWGLRQMGGAGVRQQRQAGLQHAEARVHRAVAVAVAGCSRRGNNFAQTGMK